MPASKRLISLILCAALLIGILPTNVFGTNQTTDHLSGWMNFIEQKVFSENTFTDVNPGDWFYENVKSTYQFGLMIGNSATTFNPEGNLSVAETVTVAARLHSIYNTGKAQFIQRDPWYQTYLDYAKRNKILTKDYSDYTRPATRAEVAMILADAFPEGALQTINYVVDDMIPDVKIDDEYGIAVYTFYRVGILIGYDDAGTFLPNNPIKRGELAAIISRIVDISLRQWKFTVSFNGNGENVENLPETQTVRKGKCASEPNPPTREGYEFIGWFTDAICTESYDFGQTIEEDITLYAGWSQASEQSISYKENRAIVLDISDYYDPKQLESASILWSFTAESPNNKNCIRIDDEASSNTVKRFIITNEGAYRVSVSGKAKSGEKISHQWNINVGDDLPPVASFMAQSYLVERNREGIGAINLEDASYSGDEDEIGSRIWSVRFDSDNDGDFSDEEEEVFETGNREKVAYFAREVGKYEFNLEITESFDDTIPALLPETAFLKASTKQNESIQKVVEVTYHQFTVQFVGNGDDVENLPASQKVNEGSCAVEPGFPERVGYDFTGWYVDAACSSLYNFDSPVEDDLTIYAGWIRQIMLEESYKENRKIVIDLSKSFDLERLDLDSLSWQFTAPSPEEESQIKYDEQNSSNTEKHLIISKAGIYHVSVAGRALGGEEISCQGTLTIVEDLPPVAGFMTESEVVERNGEGVASITLDDISYSPDGDTIGSRIWRVRFDSDNDGDFSDEKEEAFQYGNLEKVTYPAKSVGKYEFELVAAEYFDDTIPSLLDDNAYRISSSRQNPSVRAVVEVDNHAPESLPGISKAKEVDIVMTVGNASVEDIDKQNGYLTGIKRDLEQKDYDVRLSTVSTSTLTAKDTFAWKEYDHYNYRDSHLPTLEKHILYEEDSIRMVGYGREPLRDWLFVDEGIESQVILSFDMIRDKTDWHSIEGGGFLFNTAIGEETMSGYCILLVSSGFKLIQFADLNIEAFRNGGVSNTLQTAGKVLLSIPVQNVYDSFNIRIVADKRIVSVFINDVAVIENFVLSDQNVGTGFGPIVCHGSHNCSQQSYYTFSNIRMSTIQGDNLGDVLNSYPWRPSAEHFVVNLSSDNVYDLADEMKIGEAAQSIITHEINFIGIGISNAKDQYRRLLKSAKGVYFDLYDTYKDEDLLKNYLLNHLNAIDYSISNYIVTTEDDLSYNNSYIDKENDPSKEQLWTYDLDASTYENSTKADGAFTKEQPIKRVEDTGTYKIASKVMDDPAKDNESLSPYRKWSEESVWSDALRVHRKPVADVSYELFATNDVNEFVCDLTFEAYDLDALSHENKGVAEEVIEWKCVDDDSWTTGIVPKIIEAERVYLQKYIVQDEQGEWSMPCVKLICAEKQENSGLVVDEEPPEVTFSVSDESPCLGDGVTVFVSATDNMEITYLFVKYDGRTIWGINGEKTKERSARIICDEAGDKTLTVECGDIGGNTITKSLVLHVTDERDYTAPTIEIDPENDLIVNDKLVTIRGSITDNVLLRRYTVKYAPYGSSDYSIVKDADKEVINDKIASFSLPDDAQDSYEIIIEAFDAAGNWKRTALVLTITQTSSGVADQTEETETVEPPVIEDIPAVISLVASTLNAEIGDSVTLSIDAEDGDGLVKLETYKDDVLLFEGSGQIRFTEAEPKTVTFKTVAVDANGNEYEESTEISVVDSKDWILPTAIITSPEVGDTVSGQVPVIGSALDESSLRGYVLEYKNREERNYHTITSSYRGVDNAELGVWDTYHLVDGVYELRLVVTDDGGNVTYAALECLVQNENTISDEDLAENLISFSKPDDNMIVDDVLTIVAQVDPSAMDGAFMLEVKKDGASNSVAITEYALDNSVNKITATVETALFDNGKYALTLAAKCTDGRIAKKEVHFYVEHQNHAPGNEQTCKLLSPAEMEEVTEKTAVEAEIPSVFTQYKLEYSVAGQDDYVLFAQGDVPDSGNVIGEFDPTLLKNGYYDIRLTAAGKGITATDLVTVNVAGNMKIGNFSLSFADMDMSVSGIPVSAIRTYDSRVRNTNGELGYGWSLALENISLDISCDQSENWTEEVSSGGFLNISTYSIKETKPHRISVNLGNGKKDEFLVQPTPSAQAFMPIQYFNSVEYVALNQSKSTLKPVGVSTDTLLYLSGSIYTSMMEPYNPQQFIYTTQDGTEYLIDAEKGLQKITTTNDETITFSRQGIDFSNGKYIKYLRDDAGRVTAITNDAGETISYAYDVFGDLVSFTDLNGYQTQFVYEDHYLTQTIDPRGIAVSRNEYDDDGRLVKTIDAEGNEVIYEHNLDGREEYVTDRNGGVTRYIYDNKGNVLSLTDPNGNTTTKTYDENGNISTSTDALGNVTHYNYDAQGNMLSLTNAEGNTVTNEYNSKGLLTSINAMGVTAMTVTYDSDNNVSASTDALGNVTNYSRDGNGNLKSVTDNIGVFMNMTYDQNGNVISTTNGVGTTATFTYDDTGKCLSKTLTYTSDGESKTITEYYTYDKSGNPLTITDTAGNITTTEYNSIGKIATATDAKGRKTTYSYDALGNLIKISYADGTFEAFTYDREGNNLTATDRSGITITMTYDKVGNLISTTYPTGAKIVYSYDKNYNLVSETRLYGDVESTTTYDYDKAGRNTAITDAFGNTTRFAYNSQSLLETMTDPLGNVYTYYYDLNGLRIKTLYPNGESVSATYDARGRITGQTDPNGYTTAYTYDGADQLLKVTNELGGETQYTYDEVGDLVAITDANGNITRYTYDNLGRVIKVTNAGGLSAETEYDSVGNITAATDFAGKRTVYTYYEFDRLITSTSTDGIVTYTYTDDGKLSSVTDNTGTTTYTYGSMNELTKVTYPNGQYVSYAYDEWCRQTEINTSLGRTQYEYDILDRVIRVVDRKGNATVYEYDANGNRSAVRYSNGIVVKYEYDSVNCLILEQTLDKNDDIVSLYSYTLGKAGERLKVTELDRTEEYTYDRLYRLIGEKRTEADESVTECTYAYDNVSNRILKTENGEKTVYTYNALNQLTSENDTTYTYDDAGNLISVKSQEKSVLYTYNADNRLIRATVQEGNKVAVEEYEYDYAGNRTVKKSENDYTYYLNDVSGSLSYVIAELDADGAEKCYYTRGLELISQEREDISFYLCDGHGSVRKLTDKNGVVTDTYTYDAWGNLIASTGNTENSYLYCAEQLDNMTGLYYLRARYMDPATGTFISMDTYPASIFDPATLHRYLYANANPVMYVDPSGYLFGLADFSLSNSINNILDKITTLNLEPVFRMVRILKKLATAFTIAQTAAKIFAISEDSSLSSEEKFDAIVHALATGAMHYVALNYMCEINQLEASLRIIFMSYLFEDLAEETNKAIQSGDLFNAVLYRFRSVALLAVSIFDSCFTGDTLVAVEDGYKQIEEIEVGDKVWAYNYETGETELKEVKEVYVHEVNQILHLSTSDGAIKTTSNHPFYVPEKGWIAAGDLTVGDAILQLDGTTAVVLFSEIEYLSENIRVYNLEVEDYHTYFVGEAGALVHNYSKRTAMREAKRSQNIPMNAEPTKTYTVNVNPSMDGQNYQAPVEIYGDKFIRDDFGGHYFPDDGSVIPPHYNAGTATALPNGDYDLKSYGDHFFYDK